MNIRKSDLTREILYELKEGLGIECTNPDTFKRNDIEVKFDLNNLINTFLNNEFDDHCIKVICLYKVLKTIEDKHSAKTKKDLKFFYDNLD